MSTSRLRKLSIGLAVAATILPILAAVPAAAEVAEPESGVQQIGPGQYFPESKTFEVSETDVAAGAIGRRHRVAAVDGGLARPEAVNRTDLAVFGPGWQAEFLGGTTSRSLNVQGDTITVSEQGLPGSIQYDLKSSVSFPAGGGVRKFEAADGSKLSETTRWDSTAGALRSTVAETPALDLGPPADGTATSSADYALTYTWAQVNAADPASWRVTSVGDTAYGTSSVSYDPQGRVASVTEPAAGESPQSVLTFAYATATTATSGTFGDFAGRVKEVSLATGSAAAQVVARYRFDTAGYLRTVTDPGVGEQAGYAYDASGRVSVLSSEEKGAWQLSYAGSSAAPAATSTGPDGLPDAPDSASSTQPPPGAPSLTDPSATGPPTAEFPPGGIDGTQAYPRQCWFATAWLWYTRNGCSAWVAHYGWHKPFWRQLPSRRWVVGILYDHCTSPVGSFPGGFDFRAACDMHDYGYGLIGNTYKGYRYYLDRGRKTDVDDVFYTTLRIYTCSAYKKQGNCRAWAWIYRLGVRAGNPRNGANAT
ncbi:phospholipase A2 [Nonomuraea guangzhouensis]|uniref:Phospholipase A2 n=1 Tax=Nonomuraea guangzhouensis TaxID=1291555 RepID=A0ABW4GDM3_9ACTN|nr:phospholipase A2 [Nonomuraea guangzhouensis]